MKLVLAIECHSLKPLAFRFTLSSVTKIAYFGVVSGIKEAYKGLLNGDILWGLNVLYPNMVAYIPLVELLPL